MKKLIKWLLLPLAITPFFCFSCSKKEIDNKINSENQILIEKLNKIINEQREKINTKENNIESLKKQIENLHKDLETIKKNRQQDIENYKKWYDENERKKLYEQLNNNYNNTITKLNQKIETLKNDKNNNKWLQEQIEKIRDKHINEKNELKKIFNNEIKKLKDENNNLKKDLEKLQKNINEINDKNNKLLEQNEKLKNEIEQLKKKHKQTRNE